MCAVCNPEDKWPCGIQCMDQVKGWTRASVIATFLSVASEIDISDPAGQELLKPLVNVLDKCWMVPCHVVWPNSQNSLLFSP